MLMLESSVTFFAQLRGTEQSACSPHLDYAYSGESETFTPHSSTNMKSLAPIPWTTRARQAVLKKSS
jgi:hypothetical protein